MRFFLYLKTKFLYLKIKSEDDYCNVISLGWIKIFFLNVLSTSHWWI